MRPNWKLVVPAVLAVSFAAAPAFAGAQQYLNPNFAAIAANHKTVAVLPFKVTIDTKRLKDVSLDVVHQNERDEGVAFQKQLYIRLLQKSADEHYTVGFQDADQTIALLTRAGIPLDSVAFHTKDEIAKLLGVDALISGTIQQSQPTSQGMALTQSLLIGVHGSTQRVDISILVHNGTDGALLWSYDHTDSGGGFTGSIANNAEAMVKSLLKKVAGNFPYRVKK
jgi:hypothetical protein